MANCKFASKLNPIILTAKMSGLFILSFCTGMIAGLFLPVAFIAVIETMLLILLAWLCLFRW